LNETAGLERRDEPVHTSLAVYADRVHDPKREVRVVSVDPLSGEQREVPSQVHEVKYYKAEGVKAGEEYQPTTTFQLAFFADVPAGGSRVYLAFYGNPKAKPPAYSDGLAVSGHGPGIAIDNLYRVGCTQSGSTTVQLKMGWGPGSPSPETTAPCTGTPASTLRPSPGCTPPTGIRPRSTPCWWGRPSCPRRGAAPWSLIRKSPTWR
jgi:hypothetical protein